jgi:hypothetical protein
LDPLAKLTSPKLIAGETERWAKVIRAANIKPERSLGARGYQTTPRRETSFYQLRNTVGLA